MRSAKYTGPEYDALGIKNRNKPLQLPLAATSLSPGCARYQCCHLALGHWWAPGKFGTMRSCPSSRLQCHTVECSLHPHPQVCHGPPSQQSGDKEDPNDFPLPWPWPGVSQARQRCLPSSDKLWDSAGTPINRLESEGEVPDLQSPGSPQEPCRPSSLGRGQSGLKPNLQNQVIDWAWSQVLG